MAGGERPNKSKRDFSGMKQKPKQGRYKLPKKKYGPFSYQGKIKPGMSEYQKKTMNEFMKVREGETLEQWKRRTQERRLKSVDEIHEQSLLSKIRIVQRSRERNNLENRYKFIRVQPVEREFDFMRYYGIVINYYSIKYGIRKEDLEVGFYFYSNLPFTRERFNNSMVLITGTSSGKLNRFIKEGLIEELMHVQKKYDGSTKRSKTSLFVLNKYFIVKLSNIYRTLGKMNTIQINQPIFDPLTPEIKQMIKDMNDEVNDILTGRKPQSK